MNTNLFFDLNMISNVIIENLGEGVIILSHTSDVLYLNKKAQEIYQKLRYEDLSFHKLSSLVTNSLNGRKNSNPNDELLIIDYEFSKEQKIRIRVHYLNHSETFELEGNRPWMALFLEDRHAVLQTELKIEQQKYNLTDRELQVLDLLSQSRTYQEISEALQVTINTVKFHVKNIYLKKQSFSEEEFFIRLEN